MDAYRDEGMGDVIVGKEFCSNVDVKAKRFEGMITIYNGNDEKIPIRSIQNIAMEYLEDLEDINVVPTPRKLPICRIGGAQSLFSEEKNSKKCMTRRSMKGLVPPFEDPECAFQSNRKLFKTTSLVSSSFLELEFVAKLEDQFNEEETTITMTKPTMEDGSDHEDPNEHIEKVFEIDDLFHIPKITTDQVMLKAFPMSLTEAANRWLRNEPSGSIKDWETLKKKFFSKYCPPARTAKKIEEINNFQ
ncbi:retrovirus-related pol polyprotein from transposon TNT 1-94 [Tanacetum coccineum]|uniref:Retrovirus-related pol polyprotein from transposon TNT 1-94 n=1 Tax=Tanacetum coccineum TaxID=301880 RepID=A0ABQ5DX81_9ASTR